MHIPKQVKLSGIKTKLLGCGVDFEGIGIWALFGCQMDGTLMERVLALVVTHTGQGYYVCPDIDLQWSFASQILTFPFLWKIFPHLKEVIQV